MAPVPTKSPVTGKPVGPNYIHSNSAFFRDNAGRHLLLRGVNLSGSSKAPLYQPSQRLDDWWESAERGGETFVGQPLRLDDGSADVHLARLRGWGFNMLRYVVTWESLEREGPGKYDDEFIDYTVEVLRKCKDYGFKVFMDPHQDVWSRFSGGSGAPYWTLPACGFDPRNFTATMAAFLHSEYPTPEDPDPASYPAMIWSTNYQRFISQTIFTLFYGGRDFAPKCIIDGVNIQDWLQMHFVNAMVRLAGAIRDAGDLLDDCVIGWDSMNEPGEGLIGYEDVSKIPKSQALKKGPSPTAFEGMRLGMGEAVTVDNWVFSAMGPARSGSVTVDPKGKRCWMDPADEAGGSKWGWKRDPGWELGTCVWALHGVWEPSSSTLLRPDYFLTSPSAALENKTPVSFVPDYWRPEWIRWARKIREMHPEAIHFIQPPVFHPPPLLDEEDLGGRVCASPHYYDGLTLLTRHWNWFNADALGILRGKYSTILQGIRIGEPAIRKSFREQLGVLKQDIFDVLGQYPTLIGEIGIPYDMDGKAAYGYADNAKGKGDYSSQQKALDASLNACDGANALNYTIWTYVTENSHEWGDNWNLEDLSLWSVDDTRRIDEQPKTQSDAMSAASHRRLLGSQTNLPQGYPSSNAASSTSLPSIADSPSQQQQPAEPVFKASMFSMSEGVELPRDVLTNGSRAVGAFSRPYPVATNGVPASIDFDIKSSTFKLSVNVWPDDIISDATPTEIYLPWIHYASKTGFTKASTKTLSTTTTTAGSTPSEASDTTAVDVKAEATHHEAAIDGSGATARLPPFEIDVVVEISHGRFEIDGQTLRWWYPSPAARSWASSGGDGKRTYSLVVKRRGGPLKEVSSASSTSWDVCRLFSP